MFRFLHTADIHLDSPLRGLETQEGAPVEDIRGATRRAFDKLIDRALKEKVDFVLIAGDLYDGDWKDYNTGLFFVARMGRLNAAGIRVVMISGNHDAVSQITRTMPLPANVTVLSHHSPESVVLEDLNVVIHGQSYASRGVTENLALHYPRFSPGYYNIGLLHTALSGRPGHAAYAPCTLDDLRSRGYDYWALGHVHQREIISEEPLIVFPGNLQGRHIKESGAKGAMLVTVGEEGKTVTTFIPLNVVFWALCPVDVGACRIPDDLYAHVQSAIERVRKEAEGNPLVVRVVLQGSSALHDDLNLRGPQWTEELRGITEGMGEVWLEKVLVKTRRKVPLSASLGEASTPLDTLLANIAAIDWGEGGGLDLIPELTVLKSKMPPELLDDDSLFSNSKEQIAALKEDVREFLIAKLKAHGENQ